MKFLSLHYILKWSLPIALKYHYMIASFKLNTTFMHITILSGKENISFKNNFCTECTLLEVFVYYLGKGHRKWGIWKCWKNVIMQYYWLIKNFSISINFSHYIYTWCLQCRYVFISAFLFVCSFFRHLQTTSKMEESAERVFLANERKWASRVHSGQWARDCWRKQKV